jgi:hypothetical protein
MAEREGFEPFFRSGESTYGDSAGPENNFSSVPRHQRQIKDDIQPASAGSDFKCKLSVR